MERIIKNNSAGGRGKRKSMEDEGAKKIGEKGERGLKKLNKKRVQGNGGKKE